MVSPAAVSTEVATTVGGGKLGSDGGGKVAEVPDLQDATMEQLAAGLAAGRFSSVDLVRAYLARIAEVNEQLRAVTEVNPAAEGEAAARDAERAAGRVRGPLHGVPVLVKNNMATGDDGMNNTVGSFALLGAREPRAAGVVRRLRAGGAVVLGKATLSQWAGFRSSAMWANHCPDNSSHGWSAHGGQVRGAYIADQDPMGSSSGSAVATSIGLAAAALGTETVGSIIGPAQQSNCVGLKPTVGLTSRDMIVPLSQHQDSPGPITRTVRDAALLLQAIAGRDAHDAYTAAMPYADGDTNGANGANGTNGDANGGTGAGPAPPLPDYAAACRSGALRGARLGVPRNLIIGPATPPEAQAAFEAALDELRTAGATIVDNTNVSDEAAADNMSGQTQLRILAADFASDFARYAAQLTANPHGIRSVADLRAFTHKDAREAYPDRDTGLWDATLASKPPGNDGEHADAFADLWAHNLDLVGRQGLTGAMDAHKLDGLILPAVVGSYFPARLGTPIITVPTAVFAADAPTVRTNRDLVATGPGVGIGLSFLGKAWDEERLIGWAYDYEQRTHVRDTSKPLIKPTTQIQTKKP